jgi:PKD domain/Glucodextranase, domain B
MTCINVGNILKARVTATVTLALLIFFLSYSSVRAVDNPQSGSIGVEGSVPGSPPSQPATITIPSASTTTSNSTMTITGICPKGSLVKVFKNNVFAGAAQCTTGSYSIQIELFTGENEIVSRVYNELDQAGPDSNIIRVTYNAPNSYLGQNRVLLTTNFAKRGASLKQTLVWPIAISGGDGPYAISVDWGDGTKPDIQSQTFPGSFNISHVYNEPGVYTVTVRAVDKNGNIAFLQLVGVANGGSGQDLNAGAKNDASQPLKDQQAVKVVWWPPVVAIPFIAFSFWLGRRHQLRVLKKRLSNL